MDNKNSRIGLVTSLAIHGAMFAGVWMAMNMPPPEKPAEEVTSISMEMMAAMLEQPQVAVAPETQPEPEQPKPEEPKPEEKVPEPEPVKVPEPVKEPEPLPKPVEKPKPKPVEKPKEKPKPKEPPKEKPKPVEKPKPKETPKPKKVEAKPVEQPIKAIERGVVAQQGIVAKVAPNAQQSTKVQAGVTNGAASGGAKGSTTGNATASSGSEIAAYKAALQRALQRRALGAYPARERQLRRTGVVTLAFSVSPTGQVTNVSVANSSGNESLDAAAVKAAQSTKVEPPPAAFPTNLTVPVRFSLSD